VRAEALPQWQAKKAAIIENAVRSAKKAARRAAAEEKGRIQAVALTLAFEAVEPRLESLLDKVLAEMNATDLAKEYEIALNELKQAFGQYVSETAPNCDEYTDYVVLSKVRELKPEINARHTVLLFGDREAESLLNLCGCYEPDETAALSDEDIEDNFAGEVEQFAMEASKIKTQGIPHQEPCPVRS
jgi:hypothetical protein